jgi:uncharacterized membrane protein YfcA
LVAFLAALLTFFSGFGLGTLLTPVFLLFFPADLAIALTGVVHFFNNLFKLVLVGRQADRQVVLRFGLPAVLAALLGAAVMLHLSGLEARWTYGLAGRTLTVTPFKLLLSVLLAFFALMDLVPYFRTWRFDRRWLPWGGLLSGFFGGLSGHQGALRSAFLIRAGLSRSGFIGTAVVISSLVDLTRLSVYADRVRAAGWEDQLPTVGVVTAGGILGSWLGNRLLEKVTLARLQQFVAILLFLLSLALASGWL